MGFKVFDFFFISVNLKFVLRSAKYIVRYRKNTVRKFIAVK